MRDVPHAINVLQTFMDHHADAVSAVFPDVIRLLLAWLAEPNASEDLLANIGKLIPKLWPFWLSRLDDGLEIMHQDIMDVNTLVEAAAARASVALASPAGAAIDMSLYGRARALVTLLKSLCMAIFVSINPGLKAPPSTHTQIFAIVESELSLTTGLLGLIIQFCYHPILLATVVSHVHLVLQIEEFGSDDTQSAAFDLLVSFAGCLFSQHLHYGIRLGISNWIIGMDKAFDLYKRAIQNPKLVDMFLYPSVSPVLRQYRIWCLSATQPMRNLAAFLIRNVSRLRESVAADAYPTRLQAGELLEEAAFIMDRLMNNTNHALQKDTAVSISHPERFAYLSRVDDVQLCRFLALDVQISVAAIHCGRSGYKAPAVFEAIDTLRCRGSISADLAHTKWWPCFESILNSSLDQSAAECNYFIPPLLLSAKKLRAETSWPLVQRQFSAIAALFDSDLFSQQVVAMHWTRGILEFIKDKNRLDTGVSQSGILQLVETLLIDMLKASGTHPNATIRLGVSDLWQSYLRAFASNRRGGANTTNILDMIEARLDDIDPRVRDSFWQMACLFDPIDVSMCLSSTDRPHENTMSYLNVFKDAVMTLPAYATFRPHHFELVATYLGISSPLQPLNEDIVATVGIQAELSDWLPRLFHAAQTMQLIYDLPEPPPDHVLLASVISRDAMVFWMLWEAAKFCVLSRLSTSFGAPLKTLEAIKQTLISHQDLLRRLKRGECSDSNIPSQRNMAEVLQRVRHLLDFVYLLEIQIFAPMHGSLYQMPPVPKAAMLFIHVNQHAFREWFSRIRDLIIDVAQMVEHDSFAIWHSYNALEDKLSVATHKEPIDLMAWQCETAFVVGSLCRSLLRSKDADGLLGLALHWRSKSKIVQSVPLAASSNYISTPSVHEWIGFHTTMAQGGFETATRQLTDLSAMIGEFEKEAFGIDISTLLNDCYMKLGNWSLSQSLIEGPRVDLNVHVDTKSWEHSPLRYGFWLFDRHRLETNDGSDLQKRLLELGPNAFAHRLQAAFVAHTLGQSSGSAWDISDSLSLMHGLHNLIPCDERDRRLALLVLGQTMFKVAHTGSTPAIPKSSVRIGQTRSKDRICPDAIVAKNLQDWMRLLAFLKELEMTPHATKRDPDLDEIRGTLADLSRKIHNHTLAKTLLSDTQGNLTPSARIQNNFKLAQLLYEEGHTGDAYTLLLKVAGFHNPVFDRFDLEVKGRACGLIAKWSRMLKADIGDPQMRGQIKNVLGTSGPSVPPVVSKGWLSFYMHKRATEIVPDYPDAWFSYGVFCHYSGLRALDEVTSSSPSSFANSGTSGYVDDTFKGGNDETNSNNYSADVVMNELRNIHSALETVGRADLYGAAISGLLRDLGEIPHDAKIIDWSNSLVGEGSSIDSANDMSTHAQSHQPTTDLETLMHATARVKSSLASIRRYIFDHFKIAVTSFFRYLHVQGATHKPSHIPNNDMLYPVAQSSVASKRSWRGNTITATLRLIRLFTKYGADLHAVFADGFSSTPPLPWAAVIPQLLSRLHHPEPIVRQEITGLVCRIGAAAPHLVIYPVAVAATTENQHSDYAQAKYTHLMASLRTSNGDLVNVILKVIRELQRITVLWEELWLNGLDHIQAEVHGRVTRLISDIERINANHTLDEAARAEVMRRNAANVMRPILYTMQKLFDSTIAKCASTPHEKRFVETFGETIQQMLTHLRETVGFDNPKAFWNQFKQVHHQLIQYIRRRHILMMSDLSPYLAAMEDSPATVPALSGCPDVLTVVSCAPQVVVLLTKTKPKKITLETSDGCHRSFLLKGMEDLRLDERIQQLISTINQLLEGDDQTAQRGLRARDFAVVPLGDNFGMIQWVNNADGLFSIYRKWTEHEHLIARFQTKDGAPEPPPPRKPRDAFYTKIERIASERKLKLPHSRKNWPLDIMRTVFNELKQETPQDLISKKLWSSSPSSRGWWDKTSAFARSVAVMSMIGYIIGLGDRHLENILLDIDRGEVVHIDFNVCFEKGRRQRVPETVPFRLTRNMVAALGPTGISGRFHLACEETMRVMRENREVLLTLLEAFIYDPLVDWRQDAKSRHEKSLMNLNAYVGILSSRVIEIKIHLIGNAKALQALIESLSREAGMTIKSNASHPGFSESSLIQQELTAIEDRHGSRITTENTMNEHEQAESQLISYYPQLEDECNSVDDLLHKLVQLSGALGADVTPLLSIMTQILRFVDVTPQAAELAHRIHEFKGLWNSISSAMKALVASTQSVPPESVSEHVDAINTIAQQSSKFFDMALSFETFDEFAFDIDAIETLAGDGPRNQVVHHGDDDETMAALAANRSAENLVAFKGVESSDVDVHQRLSQQSRDSAGTDVTDDAAHSPDKQQRSGRLQINQKQARNAHAVGILRKVKSKLDGRDYGDGKTRRTVAEQVDRLILDALDEDKLAVMFEGWTAWI